MARWYRYGVLFACVACTPNKKLPATSGGDDAGSAIDQAAATESSGEPAGGDQPAGAADSATSGDDRPPPTPPNGDDAAELGRLVEAFADIEHPNREKIERVLGVRMSLTNENPHWKFYDKTLESGPFSSASLRLKNDGNGALLSLEPRNAVTEKELALKKWGEPRLDVNPDIPPSGVIAHGFTRGSVRVSFQIHKGSHTLRSVALEWK